MVLVPSRPSRSRRGRPRDGLDRAEAEARRGEGAAAMTRENEDDPEETPHLTLHLAPAAARAVRKGHPWVFDQAITKQNREGPAGALAVLYDQKRRFVGLGLYDPESPLRVRVLHRGEPTPIDRDWFRARLAESVERRTALAADPRTTAYRLVHGENDGLPGLVVDRYESTLVVKLDTAAWFPHLALVVELLVGLSADPTATERVVLRLSRRLVDSPSRPAELDEGAILHGSALDGPVVFLENGIRFAADPVVGQKTGFFLDQRDNRARVEGLSRGRDVLNVFAYTGGFSLYAARGGARRVVSLDLSGPALREAEANFVLNRDEPRIGGVPHSTLRADAFAGLRDLADSGNRFGVLILDPPSFARKEADVGQALVAYERLVKLGLGVLERGGILVAASCSARVTAEVFFETVGRTAARTGRRLDEIARTGHAIDHPVGFPEGAYLKCLFARA